MPLIKLYFTPALLLLVLTCPLWQVSQSVPLMAKEPMRESCVLYARTLLQNITDVLNQKTLFSGIDCMKQNMELYKNTSTPSAKSKMMFDIYCGCACCVFRLRELMEVCDYLFIFKSSLISHFFAAANLGTSFDQRLHLCKVLKGFQVRAITINRVIAYMTSDEYTK
uniref:Zmp:0000001127 n=1 Tax=Oreochromis aureus TaxID=47969 RepID=A0A668V897_OREAU